MNAIVKAVVLPFLIVLPITFLRIDDHTSIIRILDGQPLLWLLLIPGILVTVHLIAKGLWGQRSSPKR